MDLSRSKHNTLAGSMRISELIEKIKREEGVSVDIRLTERKNSTIIPPEQTLWSAGVRENQTIYAYNAVSQELVYSSSVDGTTRSQVR